MNIWMFYTLSDVTMGELSFFQFFLENQNFGNKNITGKLNDVPIPCILELAHNLVVWQIWQCVKNCRGQLDSHDA